MSFAPETTSYDEAFDRLDDMGQHSADEIRELLIAQGYPDPELETGSSELQHQANGPGHALASAALSGEVIYG